MSGAGEEGYENSNTAVRRKIRIARGFRNKDGTVVSLTKLNNADEPLVTRKIPSSEIRENNENEAPFGNGRRKNMENTKIANNAMHVGKCDLVSKPRTISLLTQCTGTSLETESTKFGTSSKHVKKVNTALKPNVNAWLRQFGATSQSTKSTSEPQRKVNLPYVDVSRKVTAFPQVNFGRNDSKYKKSEGAENIATFPPTAKRFNSMKDYHTSSRQGCEESKADAKHHRSQTDGRYRNNDGYEKKSSYVNSMHESWNIQSSNIGEKTGNELSFKNDKRKDAENAEIGNIAKRIRRSDTALKTDSNSFSKQSSGTLQASTPTITSQNAVNPAVVDQRQNVENAGIGNGGRRIKTERKNHEYKGSEEKETGFPATTTKSDTMKVSNPPPLPLRCKCDDVLLCYHYPKDSLPLITCRPRVCTFDSPPRFQSFFSDDTEIPPGTKPKKNIVQEREQLLKKLSRALEVF